MYNTQKEDKIVIAVKIKTVAEYPILMAEWDYEANGILKPENIFYSSKQKCYWKCLYAGHKWLAAVSSRTKTKGTGCPYCTGQKVCEDNCFATVYPELSKCWHSTKNGSLTPYDVTHHSGKRVWWQCQEFADHEWITSPATRAKHCGRCPFCLGRKTAFSNSIANTHIYVLEEWDYRKNSIKPTQIMAGSDKVVWWVCREKKHTWKASPNKRIHRGYGCPYCSKKRVCSDNCLVITHPEVAKEWHTQKNTNFKPEDVVSGTNKKIWWQCSVNIEHSWQASVASRTGKSARGCPICNKSKGEKRISEILDRMGLDYQSEKRYSNCKHIRSLPFDFCVVLSGKQYLIEYHGLQHYEPVDFCGGIKNTFSLFDSLKKRDNIKQVYCNDNGLPLLIIPYWDFDHIEEIISDFLKKQENLFC